jgi:3',5'-nucleoside bisphosphate phosphatase
LIFSRNLPRRSCKYDERLGLIDLHTHSTASDGSFSPQQLVAAADAAGLQALAITDHDTFAGYQEALPHAAAAGLRLVCGLELSTRRSFSPSAPFRSVHLLAYFLNAAPPPSFHQWLASCRQSRHERNHRLAARLQHLGFDIRLEEAQALGKHLTGRPHFAQVMVAKGYVPSLREAFRQYLDESAPAYVERAEPDLHAAIRVVREAGGLASLAHPARLVRSSSTHWQALLPDAVDAGLLAVEAYHSDHTPEDNALCFDLARKFDLAVTGGSDFHGANKPEVRLGSGLSGNVQVPLTVLDEMHNRLLRAEGTVGTHSKH